MCNKLCDLARHNHWSAAPEAVQVIRMRRTLGSLFILALAALSTAQSAFTIVRPADGSKVRETVRLLFPLSSIPDGGYVGIYIGGKFVEATVPAKGANYLYYDIDTKARNIQDGPLQVEAVLFQDFGDRPRIVDKSSVTLNVVNSANIAIPDAGLSLRYKFKPGTQWVYKLSQRVAVNNMSEARAGEMSKASLLAGSEIEQFRMLYSVENSYGGGEGLVRLQAMPDKGKREMTVTTDNSDEARTFQDYQMHPIYMRLQGTGKQIFGNIPRYFPLEGSTGEGYRTDLYALFPLPTLPSRAQKPGGAWETGFQLGDVDLEFVRANDTNTVVTPLIARGELVGVEWQNGHPCARIRHTLATRDPKSGGSGRSRFVGAQSIEEDIWFAIDLGTVIKMVRTYTIDTKIDAQPANTTGAAGGVAGGNRPNAPSAAGSSGGAVGSANYTVPGSSTGTNFQGGGRGRGRDDGGGAGGRPANVGAQGAPGGQGAAGGAGQRTGRTGTSGAGTRVVRITVEQKFELEK